MRNVLLVAVAVMLAGRGALATPPYKDPNQPYDRLPGTLETYHTKWTKPLAGGKLDVLFIIPYCNSREVVEAAQRLDINYTVIMNAGHSCWHKGYAEGATATPLKGVEAQVVLQDITRRRLNLGLTYDVIVIAKVSWAVMPAYARQLVLKHVERGTGLVYVSPNRLAYGLRSQKEVGGTDAQFTKLFETDTVPSASADVLRGLPLDVMPVHVLTSAGDYKALPAIGRPFYAEASLCVNATTHGKGRVLALDYFDEAVAASNSLTPFVPGPHYHATFGDDFTVMYDAAYALLSRAILWSSGRTRQATAALTVQAPPTDLKAPVDKELARHTWSYPTPKTVVARDDLLKAKLLLGVRVAGEKARRLDLAYRVRDLQAKVMFEKSVQVTVPPGKALSKPVDLPMLERGTYLVDVRVLDHTDQALDFACMSLRVESPLHVADIKTDKDSYSSGDTVAGSFAFSQALGAKQQGDVWAVDTWGRTVARGKVTLGADRRGGTFTLPVRRPLSELWDIHVGIRDGRGTVDEATMWVGMPNRTFDDYLFMLIFSPTPRVNDWKGNLYGTLMRRYGINSTFTYLIYSYLRQYELNARYHLRSISYAAHLGEIGGPADRHHDTRTIRTDREIGELIPMLREVARTGKPLDPKRFPYAMEFGHFQLGATFINARIADYKKAAKFGSPFYVLTGENYLYGTWGGMGCTGFGKTTTRRFQAWCRKQFGDSLDALNAEWNTRFTDWSQVRGILLHEAVEKDQMPRWVDFRYFMRSQVWSEFFIAWTDMMRRFIPNARTGRCGHDHHDFSRYRDHMTCCKAYIGQKANSEWRDCLTPELQQSFSGDRSFILAPQSMIRWTYDLKTPLNRKRWPWTVLFLGLNGFDWERGCSAPTLGGEFCFTPDMSEPLPYFLDISNEVRFLQRGIGKLTIAAKPVRSKVAMLWSPYNHYISRLDPFQPNAFSGTWMYNMSVIGGAPSDGLALLNSLRIRPTIVAPQDITAGALAKRGFRALLLPYSKGVSLAEAKAIRTFVHNGGLVIADNTPGVYSEHGRRLKRSRLKDLFPVLDKKNVIRYGKGHAAYLPGEINGYIGRFEKCDYTGSDSVDALLKTYADQTPPVELIGADGLPRRDTLMPVFRKGSTTLVGLLRAVPSGGKQPEATTVRFDKPYHVWDVRERTYCGHTRTLHVRLDLHPQYYALLPASPLGMTVQPAPKRVAGGHDLTLDGRVVFAPGAAGQAADVAQAVHVRVLGPDGRELEHYRQNVVFEGPAFKVVLPVSHSEPPGRYTVQVEHAITGMKAKACFDVGGAP